jgi:hypothetical protein
VNNALAIDVRVRRLLAVAQTDARAESIESILPSAQAATVK